MKHAPLGKSRGLFKGNFKTNACACEKLESRQLMSAVLPQIKVPSLVSGQLEQDKAVYADFSSTVNAPAGKLLIQTAVVASAQVVVDLTGKTKLLRNPFTGITLTVVNLTNPNDGQIFGAGSTTLFPPTVDDNLNFATIKATIPLQDLYSGITVDVKVNLRLARAGANQSLHEHRITPGDLNTEFFDFKGTDCQAVASGTILTNYTPVDSPGLSLVGINVAQGGSFDAQIQRLGEVDVFVSKKAAAAVAPIFVPVADILIDTTKNLLD